MAWALPTDLERKKEICSFCKWMTRMTCEATNSHCLVPIFRIYYCNLLRYSLFLTFIGYIFMLIGESLPFCQTRRMFFSLHFSTLYSWSGKRNQITNYGCNSVEGCNNFFLFHTWNKIERNLHKMLKASNTTVLWDVTLTDKSDMTKNYCHLWQKIRHDAEFGIKLQVNTNCQKKNQLTFVPHFSNWPTNLKS